MKSNSHIIIDSENIPVIVRDTMTSNDLIKIKSIDTTKGVKHGIIQLLNMIPFVGGTAAGELELTLDMRDANFFRNYIAYLYGLNDTTEEERKEFLKEVEKTAGLL